LTLDSPDISANVQQTTRHVQQTTRRVQEYISEFFSSLSHHSQPRLQQRRAIVNISELETLLSPISSSAVQKPSKSGSNQKITRIAVHAFQTANFNRVYYQPTIREKQFAKHPQFHIVPSNVDEEVQADSKGKESRSLSLS
jgi:hypothetical protein